MKRRPSDQTARRTDHPPVVVALDAALAGTARQLAAQLGLAPASEPPAAGLMLALRPVAESPGYRLELQATGRGAAGAVFAEFVHGPVGHRRRYGGGRAQPLARAAGLKQGARPQVIDATAGLGRDAFVLAGLGCRVRLLERSPIVAAVLENGLQRARTHGDTAAIAERMQTVAGDALELLAEMPEPQRPEVIYLDPMYPHRTKTALVKKEMRLFRDLVGADLDAPALLATALACARQRVVVKRPRTAAPLLGPAPTTAIESKNTRFDVYVIAALQPAQEP